jgi:SOS-response transcriptional repressor LexA
MNDPVSAFAWLRGREHLFHFTHDRLIHHMHAEAEAGDFSTALALMVQLETASQAADRLDQAEMRLECALAAWQMHDPSLATRQVESALALLGPGADRSSRYAHCYGTANWLLGLLTMPLSGSALAAATAWQNSLDAFEYLATEPGLTFSDQAWYLDRRADMFQRIDEALVGRPQGLALQPVTLQSSGPVSLEVHAEFSIARYGRPGLPPSVQGPLRLASQAEVFQIAGRPHRLFGLRGPRRILILDPSDRFCALKVTGNWMNRIGIDPGDYILLRFGEGADNGDIVAVEIFSGNSSAMVYHLHRKKDTIILNPQSTNPANQTFEFGPADGNLYSIYGVVLGLFKPSAPAPTPPPTEQANPDQEVESKPIPIEDYLRAFRIFSAIPAGGPEAAPTFSGRYLELNRFLINDRPFFIKNLRGSGKMVKPRSGNLIVLQVSGKSMNDPDKANIQDGDYVLLLRQGAADDGDIVAAEIRGEDTLATLKRYRARRGEIMLLPESIEPEFTDPKYRTVYKAHELAPADGEPPFHIQGIALAVFKPQS